MDRHLKSGFQIVFLKDPRYQYLTVEIQYYSQPVAQISKDGGIDKMEIEIYQVVSINPELSELKASLDDFIEAIKLGSQDLKNAQ